MSKKKKNKKNKKENKIVAEVVETKNISEENEEDFLEGKTIDEIIEEDKVNKKVKNYIALIILLTGLLIGSLLVDVGQLVTKKGYSPHALKNARIFSLDGKTWVAYDEPIVELKILTDSKNKDCPGCQLPPEVIDVLKKVVPTLVIKEVDVNSPAGQELVKNDHLKSLPALVFSKDLEKTKFYNGEAKAIFNKAKDGNDYILNVSALGLPVGKYIELPTIKEGDPIIGQKDAKVKIFLFSDHQCPYCAKFFSDILKVAKEFDGQVVLVYKDLPLEFHQQSKNAALAARCAKEQDKFWQMSNRLYKTQNTWGKLNDEQANKFFKKQAVSLKMNPEDFNKCLDEKKYEKEINNSVSEAQDFGITGTPALFINDQFVGGLVPTQQLKQIIQGEIDKQNGKKTEGEKEQAEKDKTSENK